MPHSRRRFFKIGTTLGGMLTQSGRAFSDVHVPGLTLDLPRSELEKIARTFTYGVASGDPLPDRVIIWTRVSGEAPSVPVRWQVALDPEFCNIVAEGDGSAAASRDYTVKIDAVLPLPNTTYYYRFHALDCWSMVGRTRTAPIDRQNIRLAIVSCSSIWSGYFNAYEALARRNDIHAIVHLGDYVYDVPDPDEMRNIPSDSINLSNPNSLEAIRQRYRYYRKDPFLRHAHQQHPWVVVWDNHDIENNAGKAASIQAFHEWIPIRSPAPEDESRIYRCLSFGGMVDLIMLDTRHIGRDSISVATGKKSILGDTQFDWLSDELQKSTAHWRIIGNQVLLAPCKIFGRTISKRLWDGFPADRERVLRTLGDLSISNTLVVSGDAHLSFAANLSVDHKPVAVEFLPTSVNRGNLDEQVKKAFQGIAALGFHAAVKAFNPHIRYFDSTAHGYGIVDLRDEGANLEFWYLPYIDITLDQTMAYAAYVANGQQRITAERTGVSTGLSCGVPATREPKLYQSSIELGGTGGGYFDDLEHLALTARLTGLKLRCGGRVDAITACYADGSSLTHGGPGGEEQVLQLRDEEYVRQVYIGAGRYRGMVSVHYLKFVTSHGRVLEGGKNSGKNLQFVADSGRHIVGFRGRSGQELDKIGPIFAPDFS